MTSFKYVVLTLVLLLIFCIEPALAKKTRVLIDPGHGGEDAGAVYENLKEKHITLKVALELREILKQDPDFIPVLTREKDEFISLDTRSEKAKTEKADVFLSIHVNSSPVDKARGPEFYFENQIATDEESLLLANRENSLQNAKGKQPPNQSSDLHNILTDLQHSEHMLLSQELSEKLLSSFVDHLKVKRKAIRQAPFRVLSVTIPSTLVELGYITNPQEAQWLITPANHKSLAQALYKGLKSFKEKLDKTRQNPVKPD